MVTVFLSQEPMLHCSLFSLSAYYTHSFVFFVVTVVFVVVAFHKDIEYPVAFQVEKEQNKILSQVEDLKRQRDACHEKLGDIKTLTSFVMQAVRFWEEVGMLTNAATIKTEQLQILMDLAAEENTERILNSKGLQTKITSFKERWMEVAEMITSDRNNLTLKKKSEKVQLQTEMKFFSLILQANHGPTTRRDMFTSTHSQK